jgi:hypothetical protein
VPDLERGYTLNYAAAGQRACVVEFGRAVGARPVPNRLRASF